jgi:hypothetical protein
MLATRCRCLRPRIFEEGDCHRCGHERETIYVSPSTMRISIAIAEYALGYKRLREGRPAKYEEAT